MTKKLTYWVSPGTTMYGITPGEFLTRLRSACDAWSSFCDVVFTQTSSKGGANFRFFGATYDQMVARTGHAALGMAWKSTRTIWVYSEEREGLDINRPWTWYVQNICVHEMGHVLGLDHSTERTQYTEAVMSSNVSSEFWTRSEVEYWQKKYGLPRYKWAPGDKAMYGRRIKETQKLRNWHKAERDNAINTTPRGSLTFAAWVAEIKKKRTYHQNENLRLMRQEIQLAQAWFFLRDYWAGTPGAV